MLGGYLPEDVNISFLAWDGDGTVIVVWLAAGVVLGVSFAVRSGPSEKKQKQ